MTHPLRVKHWSLVIPPLVSMQSRDGPPHFRKCEQSHHFLVNGSAGTGNEAGRILDAGVLSSSVLFMNSQPQLALKAAGICYSLSLFLPSQVLCALLTPLARNCLLYRHKPYIEAQTSQKGWAWLLRNGRLHGG